MFATDDFVAQSESAFTSFAQLAYMKPSQNGKEIIAKTLRCGDVHEQYALNEILIKDIDLYIEQSMCEY